MDTAPSSNPRTAPGRVAAFLTARGALGGPIHPDIAVQVSGVDLTVTDLHALVALADLGHHVVEELYMETDDEGALSPTYSGPRLIEAVTEWQGEQRAWEWHPARSLAQANAARAAAVERTQGGDAR